MLLLFLKTRGDKQTLPCCCRIVVLCRHLQAHVNLAKKKRKEIALINKGWVILQKRTFYSYKIAGINHEYTENKEKLRGRQRAIYQQDKKQQQIQTFAYVLTLNILTKIPFMLVCIYSMRISILIEFFLLQLSIKNKEISLQIFVMF